MYSLYCTRDSLESGLRRLEELVKALLDAAAFAERIDEMNHARIGEVVTPIHRDRERIRLEDVRMGRHAGNVDAVRDRMKRRHLRMAFRKTSVVSCRQQG